MQLITDLSTILNTPASSSSWKPTVGRHVLRLIPFSGTCAYCAYTKQHFVGDESTRPMRVNFTATAPSRGEPDICWEFCNALKRNVSTDSNKRIFKMFGLSRERGILSVYVSSSDSNSNPNGMVAVQWVVSADIIKQLNEQIKMLEGGENPLDYELIVTVTPSERTFNNKQMNDISLALGRRPARTNGSAMAEMVQPLDFDALVANAPKSASSPEARELLSAFVSAAVIPMLQTHGEPTEWCSTFLSEGMPF